MNNYLRYMMIEELNLMLDKKYDFLVYNMGSGGEFIYSKIIQYSKDDWWHPLVGFDYVESVNRTNTSAGYIEKIITLPSNKITDNNLFQLIINYLNGHTSVLPKPVRSILDNENSIDSLAINSRLNHSGKVVLKSHNYYPEVMGENASFIFDDTKEMTRYRINNVIVKVGLRPISIKEIRNGPLRFDPEKDSKLRIIYNIIGDETIPEWVLKKMIYELNNNRDPTHILETTRETIIDEMRQKLKLVPEVNHLLNKFKVFKMSEMFDSYHLPNHYGVYGDDAIKFLENLNAWHRKNLKLHEEYGLN